MLKSVLFGAVMATCAPVFAQTVTPAPAAQTTTADAAVPAEQVAQAVDQRFATYDKDGDGKLDEVEFGAWMVALKARNDPRTNPDAPAIKQWNKAAFAQADTDRSKSLTKAELTGFLTPPAAAS